jgi:hypothetical protein
VETGEGPKSETSCKEPGYVSRQNDTFAGRMTEKSKQKQEDFLYYKNSETHTASISSDTKERFPIYKAAEL